MKLKRVDIIIPVYNAYESLVDCIESVLKYTDLSKNRLIIVDDKGDDRRLEKLVLRLKSNKNIICLENKENMGFVKSVNRGMKFSYNDVILLNSDTVVTSNWVEKMQNCAYSNNLIATVTPLSNNATICSVPNFGYDNKIPEGYSISTFAELIEKKSLQLYPEIPTAVGFCMYIKRSVLENCGFFDEELFGAGYGEENEFCLRSAKKGFIHVLDDTTFIYHSGSASFTDQKRIERVKTNIQILERLYPGYSKKIDDFVRENPLRQVHQNINFWLSHPIKSNKKNILIVKHFEVTFGGVGRNIVDIARINSDKFNFFMFMPDANGDVQLAFYEKDKGFNILWNFKIKSKQSSSFEEDSKIGECFEKIIDYLQIDLVHFHHFIGIPVNLIGIAKKLHSVVLVSLHDFFLLDKINGKWLRLADKVFAPSQFLIDRFKLIFPDISIKLVEHGVNVGGVIGTRDIKKKKKINIAFLGVPVQHKGIDDFVMVVRIDKGKYFNWSIFGEIDFHTEAYLKQIGAFDLPIHFFGKYNNNELCQLMNDQKIDLIALMSVVPESFSYTLSEAISCGIPVISRNVGALGQRVRKNGYGWLFEGYSDFIKVLSYIRKNPDVLEEKRGELMSKKIKTDVEMADEYAVDYDGLIHRNKKNNERKIVGCELIILNREFFRSIFKEPQPFDINEVESQQNKINSFQIMKNKIKKMPFIGNILIRLKRSVF